MKRGDIIDLKIESIAFGGAGVGRVKVDDKSFSTTKAGCFADEKADYKAAGSTPQKSMAIFVEDTVPGDDVRVRIGGMKRNYAFGYIESFNKKAENRVEPFCKHYCSKSGERCGGCTMQNLSYEDQLVIKEQNVRDSIVRIGGLDEALVRPIIGCDEPLYYRNKMEFSFSRSLEGELTFGLHVKRRHHDLVNLTECYLLAPYIGKFVSVMRDFFRGLDEKGFLRQEGQEVLHSGGAPVPRSLVVREGKRTGEIMINLIMENGEAKFLDEFLEVTREFFKKEVEGERGGDIKYEVTKKEGGKPLLTDGQRRLCSVYYTHIRNIKGEPKGMDEKLLWGSETIKEKLIVGGDVDIPCDKSVTGDTFQNSFVGFNPSEINRNEQCSREHSTPSMVRRAKGRELTFEISPQSFFQPNTLQAEKLYNLAIEGAGLRDGLSEGAAGDKVVYDLYCGAGTIGLCLAAAAKHVYGIEINEAAVNNARANALTNKIKNVTFEVGDVFKMMDSGSGDSGAKDKNTADERLKDGDEKHTTDRVAKRPGVMATEQPAVRLAKRPGVVATELPVVWVAKRPGVVVVDPPRNGLQAGVIEKVSGLKPGRVVYVSCNPTTLARDLAAFKKTGYNILSVQPVDMFPHTYHIETVTVLERA